MKLTHTLTFTLLLAGHIARAEPTAKAEDYELKRRSVVSLDKEMRAPFWPIGWQRPKDAPTQPQLGGKNVKPVAVDALKLQLNSESFSVSSILLGNPSIVVINGRSFEEGQFLPVISDDQRIKVQVRAIREQGVWLQLDKQPPILVPMRRLTIQPKSTPQAGQHQDWAIKLTPR